MGCAWGVYRTGAGGVGREFLEGGVNAEREMRNAKRGGGFGLGLRREGTGIHGCFGERGMGGGMGYTLRALVRGDFGFGCVME